MDCVEDPRFTRDYHDPDKRSIANGLTVKFRDGQKFDEVLVEYPIGHKSRRKEGIPLLEAKFEKNLALRFPAKQAHAILDLSLNQSSLQETAVNDYVDLFVI
jgi:2-methylcitrate dehydratase